VKTIVKYLGSQLREQELFRGIENVAGMS